MPRVSISPPRAADGRSNISGKGAGGRSTLEHRAGPRSTEPGVPRPLAVEAEVPRRAPADHAVAPRVGLPQVLARRSRAAALRTLDAARPLSPAQGDPG